jgi:uncharacterized protein
VVPALLVGFDLDLTLLDTRPGIAATWRRLATELDLEIDMQAVLDRVGIPLAAELAHWLPTEQVPAAVEAYRTLYREYGVPGCAPMPGAAAALATVEKLGGRAVIVTAKRADLAWQCLENAGLTAGLRPEDVTGELAGAGKAAALAGATIFVGDHPLDIEGAKAAGACSVAVTSGASSAEDLAAADVIFPDLTGFSDWLVEAELQRRLTGLRVDLQELAPVVVAFSGGADSAFLLAAAARAAGPEQVLAVTAVSPSLPAAELAAARRFADEFGVRHETVTTAELDREGYRANSGDRCYFCKAELVEVVAPIAARATGTVVTGTNADDTVAGFRPGIRAASERGARTPLADAGLTKAQVREVSRRWGLSTWDKPAAACLASRVAFGVRITPARLARVEAAEVALRAALEAADLRTSNLRVRDLGEQARVEVDAGLAPVLAARPDVLAAVQGFRVVEVDPQGFRSGSMNDLLPEPERYR